VAWKPSQWLPHWWGTDASKDEERELGGSSEHRSMTSEGDRIADIDKTGQNEQKARFTSGKLGTFSGVFVPTTLNVLSILMFLRFGLILGQSGVLCMLGNFFPLHPYDMLLNKSLKECLLQRIPSTL
jgi:solute carrier family 12 (potassium/chloride transporters), member 9